MPIPFSEIQAWSQLYGVCLDPWELDALTGLDDIWLGVMAKKKISMEDLRGEDDATD